MTEDGEFKSEVGSGRARFLTVADQVIFLPLLSTILVYTSCRAVYDLADIS